MVSGTLVSGIEPMQTHYGCSVPVSIIVSLGRWTEREEEEEKGFLFLLQGVCCPLLVIPSKLSVIFIFGLHDRIVTAGVVFSLSAFFAFVYFTPSDVVQ